MVRIGGAGCGCDDEDCEKDGHGSDGGKGEEVDEGVIEAEGEQEGAG
jgi:hypothetical protein